MIRVTEKDMFSGQDARVLALVPDYKVNLIAPASIKDEDFGKFQSSLKEDVLNACVGAEIAVGEGEEAIDVCLAIEQMNEEAAQKAAQKEYRLCCDRMQ